MPNSDSFNRFSTNPVNVDISRSMFNMDHSVKFSCNVGEVIPFDCMEVLPGDTFEIDTTKVIRLQPLVAPIMDEVILDVYWFYVPNRLVWSHWKEFMGENNQSAWAPEVEYNIPTIQSPFRDPNYETSQDYRTYFDVGTIADYLGLPVGKDDFEGKYNALPFRAYALICDQWFRSEAVMDPVHVHIDDTNRIGVNTGDQVTDIELGGKPFIACKYFDYFTSCLPEPQRGDAVELPIFRGVNAQQIPLEFARTHELEPGYRVSKYKPGSTVNSLNHGVHFSIRGTSGDTTVSVPNNYNFGVDNNGDMHLATQNGSTLNTGSYVYIDNGYVTFPRLSAEAITINDLRTAFAMQKYLEKQARYGGRYQEFIKAFFNVDSPDARLQRTEYLGGSRISLNINQVEQTSATEENSTPLGDVAGMSVTADSNSDFTKSFTEHGMIIGCAVVRYHHSYQDSVHKMWLRKTPYEFYVPVFANLGEMPVTKNQLYGYINDKDSVFGYNEAWAEYRYMPSRVAGEMRSVYQTPLDMWHLGDHYSSAPTLSPEWLREDKSNLDRCLAVTSEVSNQVICDFFIQTKAVRPMPLYSIPGLIDHH